MHYYRTSGPLGENIMRHPYRGISPKRLKNLAVDIQTRDIQYFWVFQLHMCSALNLKICIWTHVRTYINMPKVCLHFPGFKIDYSNFETRSLYKDSLSMFTLRLKFHIYFYLDI